jgi:thiol-disulfide isomerase/thioredoxin
MRKIILLLLLATLSAVNGAPQSGRKISTPRTTPAAPIQPTLTPEPEPLPGPPAELRFLPDRILDREIKMLDNSSFRLANFQGKVLVINLWASWCGPCRREVPEYEKVRKAYVGRNVEFIGLTTEDPRTSSDRVNRFLRDITFGFRLGWADREIARTLMNGRNAIPQTLVIDAEGRVVSHWTGYEPGQSGNRLKQTIEGALLDVQRR